MSIPIDPAVPNLPNRQGAVHSASLFGGEEQAAHGRLLNSARRVEPIEGSEKVRETEDDRLREGRHEQDRERSTAEGDSDDRPAVAETRYDRKLSYDADLNRVYLDIVNTKDDEVLMRLPSESTAKYLDQIAMQSDEKDDAKPEPRVIEIV